MFEQQLISEFQRVADADKAKEMAAYMKHNFMFFGISAPDRRAIQGELFKQYKNEITNEFRTIVRQLYTLPQRELHQAAIDLFIKFSKGKLVPEDIQLIEFLLTTHAWWDSVDLLSKWVLGNYCRQFPDQIPIVVKGFSESTDMWLNRSTLLFQLDYKLNTDARLLFELCEKFKQSNEFFIQKAIGWALREYSKVNPKKVIDFVDSTCLKPLSQREALRLIS
jgi:3-methyladenine DNA glycosylase AlkD